MKNFRAGKAMNDTAGPAVVDGERGEALVLVPKHGFLKRWRQYFGAQVALEHTDVLMLTCCFVSGLLDSVVYSAWGTFVSMQTGNTIFVGLGPSGQDANKAFRWAKSLTSIVCFLFGAFFFSRFYRALEPLRRSTLVLSFLLQSLLIFSTAVMVASGYITGMVNNTSSGINWKTEIPIVFLSFQAAGQIVTSRNLNLSEIPTVVLTSVICDFASDPSLLAPLAQNVKRNRRFLAFVGILAGAIAGGWISKAASSMQPVLWLAGGLKLSVAVAWAWWREKAPAATPA